MSYYGLPTFKL